MNTISLIQQEPSGSAIVDPPHMGIGPSPSDQGNDVSSPASPSSSPTAQPGPHMQQGPRPASSRLGCLPGLLHAVNRPWLLVTIPLVLAAAWLGNNTWVITNNLDKPYALLAGPALVASGLAGWLIFTGFRTIEAWSRSALRALSRARKEDGSAQFFWMVIIVFMIVSVFASGSFFTMLEHDAFPGLGYATALFIDLVAVQSMQARLNALRMRDKRGSLLYLAGVFVCAGASAFANVYTDLSSFSQQASGVLPPWMLSVAPWFGLIFPLLILLLSITADYTLDQTSSKLDPEAYKTQETKRVKLLEIQRDILAQRVAIESEIDRLSRQLKAGKQERVFFLIAWLFPKQPAATQTFATQMATELRDEFGQQLQSLYTHLTGQIGQLSAASATVRAQPMTHQIAPNLAPEPEQIPATFATHGAPNVDATVHPFTPTLFHKKALEFIQNHPAWRGQFEAILLAHPTTGYDEIARFVRQQPGMNFALITGQFVGEVLTLMRNAEHQGPISEASTSAQEPVRASASQAQRNRQGQTITEAEVDRQTDPHHAVVTPASGAIYEPEAPASTPTFGPQIEELLAEMSSQFAHGNASTFGPNVQTPRPELSSQSGPQQTPTFGQHMGASQVAMSSQFTGTDAPTFDKKRGETSGQSDRTMDASDGAISPSKQGRVTRKLAMSASRHPQTSDLSPSAFVSASAPQFAPTERAIREPYVVTIAEAAERKGCSIKAIEEAIARTDIRQPRRGDGSKVLLSSLEEWTPPKRQRTRK